LEFTFRKKEILHYSQNVKQSNTIPAKAKSSNSDQLRSSVVALSAVVPNSEMSLLSFGKRIGF